MNLITSITKNKMKKYMILLAAAFMLSLVGCDSASKYTEKGQKLAQELDQSVEKQDTAAALAAERAIRQTEKEVIATGDSVAIANFQKAVKESKERNAPYLTALKVKNGMNPDEAVGEVIGDVMNGQTNISTVTTSIDSVLLSKKKK